MDPWSLLNCDNDSTVNKLFTRLSQDIRLPAGEDHTVIFCLKWSEPPEVIRTTWSDQNHLKWTEPLGVIRNTNSLYYTEESHESWQTQSASSNTAGSSSPEDTSTRPPQLMQLSQFWLVLIRWLKLDSQLWRSKIHQDHINLPYIYI